LLNCDFEINLALRTARELLFKSQENRGGSGLIYCSIMQVYQNELTDLLTIPNQNQARSDKKVPYFVDGREQGGGFIAGTNVVMVSGQILQPVRCM
jgi:hypothetical protein